MLIGSSFVAGGLMLHREIPLIPLRYPSRDTPIIEPACEKLWI